MRKSDQLKKLILEQLYKNPIIEVACQKIGISRMTFYRWKENQDFSKAVDKAMIDGRLLVNDLAESQLIGAVKDRNFQAIAYWLKHHHPSYKTKIEIEGKINTIQEMTPEQKELVKKALAMANLTINKKDEKKR
ncbi:MAG: phBC6A51 family helix-turn-helix protein [Candidatus Portnoybacteria bacterium]|nr:phBC6A51 family helix-turn-helix protein [Candidatus Portnoybacteria bacterium]MDD4983012.1 phBC6A51 family helix-turn-helix protein [Candidatus Portnoybacteria bacterium]